MAEKLLITPCVPMLSGEYGVWNDPGVVLPKPGQQVLVLFAHAPDLVQTHILVEDFGHGDIGLNPIMRPVAAWMAQPRLPKTEQPRPSIRQQLSLF